MKRLLSISVTLLLFALLLNGCQNPSGNDTKPTPPAASPSPSVSLATPTPASTGSPAATAQDKTKNVAEGMKTTPSGLQYQDIVVGTGPKPLLGQTVSIAYTGWLQNGKQFETNVGKEPFLLKYGMDSDIKGWKLGIAGSSKESIPPMRVGGKRKLIIPPDLAYGTDGSDVIPGNATLTFEVEVRGIRRNSGMGL